MFFKSDGLSGRETHPTGFLRWASARNVHVSRMGAIMLTKITTAVTVISALTFGGMALAQDKPPPVSPSPVKRTVLGKV